MSSIQLWRKHYYVLHIYIIITYYMWYTLHIYYISMINLQLNIGISHLSKPSYENCSIPKLWGTHVRTKLSSCSRIFTKPSPTELKDNFLPSSLDSGMSPQLGQQNSSRLLLVSWRRMRQRRWFQAQYLTQLNYTWLLFASHSLKRIPLPDLSVWALLKLSTFIHMYG